jgi:hypothetical protein
MKPRIDLFITRFPRLLSRTKDQISRTLMLAMVLLATPFGSRTLLAQQNVDPWPTDDPNEGPYSNQQPSNQQYGYGQPQDQQGYSDPNQTYQLPNYQQPQGYSAERLEQMLAPIALYPDNLVSIVLAASTYPAQVATADQWLHMQGNAAADQIAAGADAQTAWDPSVKALTAFPQVLDQLAQNIQWTTDLGNAYYNQPQDVTQTIQVMRSRAQSAGNLQSTPQEQVSVDQGNIELAPSSPQVVYVPSYDPWVAYGAPVPQYPGYWFGAGGGYYGGAFLRFGPAVAIGAFAPFGWFGWGVDWFSHALLFNHGFYCTHSYEVRDWGFAHGGPRGFRGWDRPGFHDSRGWGREDFLRASNNHGSNQQFGRFGNDHIARGTLNRGGDFNRGYQNYGNTARGYGNGRGSGNSYGRSGSVQEAYNPGPRPTGRPMQYDGRYQNQSGSTPSYGVRPSAGGRQTYGSSYGSGMYGYGGGRSVTSPSAPVLRSPMQGYRNEQARSYGNSGGGFAQPRSGIGNEHVSGGFHVFGSGHQNGSFSSGGRAPQSPSFGGGHSGWGGGGGFKGPSTSHFGGGGFKAPSPSHFGGGGGGGGHSGGGGRRH